MGWLRELMARTEPPLGSYGELARGCLSHPDWPSHVQPKPRSLASLFSKFDRGIELEWLADREPVQRVLCQVLACSRSALRLPISEHLHTAEVHQERWRLPDAPFARLLDLREDALPPGIPRRAQIPATWGRLWWLAGPGDGVELTRRWLAARGLAKTRVARCWADVEASAGGDEPLFVELQCSADVPSLPGVVHAGPLCIAGPAPARAPEGFDQLSSPPLRDYLASLLEWLEPLFPKDGRFEAAAALRWMQEPVNAALIDSLQSAIGLAGVLDELGLEQVEAHPIEQLARHWLQRRVDAAETRSTGAWLGEPVWPVLLAIAKRALTDDDLPLATARTRDEWLKLVPPELQGSVDAEWARASLARAGTPLTNQQLQQALAKTPPGAYRIISALQAAAILQPLDLEHSQLTPRWLVATLQRQAALDLLAEAPSEWGEALLRPAAQPLVRRELRARLDVGDARCLDELLELPEAEQPSYVVAIEAAFEAMGDSWLTGHELEDEIAGSLLELQRRYWIESDQPGAEPAPRLLCARQPEADYGAWLMAWWALERRLGAAASAGASTLPHPDPETGSPSTLALDAIAAYLDTLEADDPRLARCHRLLSRRFSSRMPDHALFAPARVVAAPGDWDSWKVVHQSRNGLSAVQSLAHDFASCAAEAWRAWQRSGFAPEGTACFAGVAALWAHVPADVLGQLLQSKHPLAWNDPDQHLQPKHYQLLLELQPLPRDWVRRLSMIGLPAELISGWTLILAQAGHRAALEQLWRRHEALMLMETLMVLETGESTLAEELLMSSPSNAAPALIREVRQHLQRVGVSHPLTSVIRRWLHVEVTQRRANWRDSYQVLAQIERRLKRVQVARGRRPKRGQQAHGIGRPSGEFSDG